MGLECHKCQERDSSGITQSCFSDDDSYGLKETCPSGSPHACYKDVKRNVQNLLQLSFENNWDSFNDR